MGVNEKLLEKMRRKPIPNDISMNELNRLLLSRGFTLQSRKGSHLNYKHPKLSNILTIVSHDDRKSLLATYIKNALIALEEIEN